MSHAKGLREFELELKQETFDKFSSKMYGLTGVNLPYSSKNVALVKNRLSKILRKYKFEDYEQYWNFLQSQDGPVIEEFISALTTNMTSFFREPSHFQFLQEYLKKNINKSEIRLWCAAASTGQEPFTIALTVFEQLGEAQSNKVKILATDIDLDVLKKAQTAFYLENEMQGLSENQISSYFQKGIRNGKSGYFINNYLKKMITFAQFNLVNDNYRFRKPLDLIFCRNVLIYFDEQTSRKVINSLVLSLNPGGYLILGHSESGHIKHKLLQPLSKAIYQRLKE